MEWPKWERFKNSGSQPPLLTPRLRPVGIVSHGHKALWDFPPVAVSLEIPYTELPDDLYTHEKL